MKKFFCKFLAFIPALCLLALATSASAFSLLNENVISNTVNQTDIVANQTFNPDTDEYTLTEMVADIISVFLGLLGTIFVFLIILAGYNWMTAGGDSGKVSKAQTTIKVAIIGLIIIVGAYAITWWIFARMPAGE